MRLPGSILQGILARVALTFLRIYFGVVLLVAAWAKLQYGYAGQLAELLQRGGEGGHGWYQRFAEQVLLPQVALVATVVAWVELLIGCCLILGLGTRLAAAVACLLAVNFMLAEGSWFWTPSSSHAIAAMVSLALLIGAAGRTLGLDAFLAKRWPRSPFW